VIHLKAGFNSFCDDDQPPNSFSQRREELNFMNFIENDSGETSKALSGF
jgi:hypothetical protein